MARRNTAGTLNCTRHGPSGTACDHSPGAARKLAYNIAALAAALHSAASVTIPSPISARFSQHSTVCFTAASLL